MKMVEENIAAVIPSEDQELTAAARTVETPDMARAGSRPELHVLSPRKKEPEAPYVYVDKPVYEAVKRVFDVVCAAIGLIVLSPLLLAVAIAIFADDPHAGPIFTQTRVGKGGREFKFYKFRSMVANADDLKESLMYLNEADGPVFKIKDDPRITRVGRFIRKTSIDELPQLWNIIRGDMSIVGPRPPLPKEVEQYTARHRRRLDVIGGLTCYWQICGRSNVPFEEWVDMDIKYIMERSLWTDIKIIAKTFGAVFGMTGK